MARAPGFLPPATKVCWPRGGRAGECGWELPLSFPLGTHLLPPKEGKPQVWQETEVTALTRATVKMVIFTHTYPVPTLF